MASTSNAARRCLLILLSIGIAAGLIAQQPNLTDREDRLLSARQLGTILNIDVHDDGGQPFENATVLVMKSGVGWTMKQTNSNGRVGLTALEVPGFVEADLFSPRKVVAVAPDYSPAIRDVKVDVAGTTETLRLSRGQMIELQVLDWNGNPAPDDIGIVAFTSTFKSAAVRSLTRVNDELPALPRFNMISPRPLGDGIYLFHWEADPKEPLYLLLDAPGLVRYVLAGPFIVDELKSGVLSTKLPKPGTITAKFEAPELGTVPEPFNEMNIEIGRVIQVSPSDSRQIVPIMRFSRTGTEMNLEFSDLAPGDYHIEAFTGPIEKKSEQYRLAAFRHRERAELQPDGVRNFNFRYKELENPYAGEYAIDVQVVTSNGMPAAGREWAVSPVTISQAAPVIARGISDNEGRLKVENLAGGDKKPLIYQLYFENQPVSYLLAGGEKKRADLRVQLPPKEGDVVPNVEFEDLQTTKPMTLDSYKGQLVVLEFWATWCGPCQQPMAKNNEIMQRRQKDWQGKAVIITVSEDDAKETAQNHLARNGWNYAVNWWAGEDDPRMGKPLPSALYGIRTIPTAFLIDRTGRIMWRGNPNSINFEKTIDDMLKADGLL